MVTAQRAVDWHIMKTQAHMCCHSVQEVARLRRTGKESASSGPVQALAPIPVAEPVSTRGTQADAQGPESPGTGTHPSLSMEQHLSICEVLKHVASPLPANAVVTIVTSISCIARSCDILRSM
jgi:hypothetical protein